MAGQRTWRRVEAPGTLRGHALEANVNGAHWRGWENSDGSWSLSINGGAPTSRPSWAAIRGAADGRVANPMAPMVASAAATGMAIAMRDHLINNPAPAVPQSPELTAVLGALGQAGLGVSRMPRADQFGNVWVMVARGQGRRARRVVRHSRFPFPVRVMEAA